MNFDSFKDVLLIGLAGICIAILSFLGNSLLSILSKIKDSIDELNKQIAVVIERTDNHEKRLDRIEDKLR